MENKERIMECALDLFYTKGYDAVGVQEIAEKAGITKPTLYYYFGSKLGLLKTILETNYEEFQRAIDEAAAYEGDVPKTLYTVASAFIRVTSLHHKMYMLMMALFYSARENEAHQAVKPLIRDFYRRIVNIFEQASCELGNMRGRQTTFAIGFMGVINHFILLAGETNGGMRQVSEDEVRELVNQFMYGIYS